MCPGAGEPWRYKISRFEVQFQSKHSKVLNPVSSASHWYEATLSTTGTTRGRALGNLNIGLACTQVLKVRTLEVPALNPRLGVWSSTSSTLFFKIICIATRISYSKAI